MNRWEFEYEVSSMPKEDQKLIGMFKNHETQARILDFCFDHSTTFNPEHNQKFGQYVRERLSESSPDLTPARLDADLNLYKARWEKKNQGAKSSSYCTICKAENNLKISTCRCIKID